MSGKTKGYLNMERKTNNDTIATLKLSGEAETIVSGADQLRNLLAVFNKY